MISVRIWQSVTPSAKLNAQLRNATDKTSFQLPSGAKCADIWGRKGFDGGCEAGKASGGRDLLNTRNLKLSANDNVYAAA